jgi:hypothetical protein
VHVMNCLPGVVKRLWLATLVFAGACVAREGLVPLRPAPWNLALSDSAAAQLWTNLRAQCVPKDSATRR